MSAEATTSSVNASKHTTGAGVFSTGFNLANIVLGIGALTMPQAFSQSGIIAGLMVLIFMSVFGHYTSLLLIQCANKIGVDSYEELTEKILGSAGYLLFCTLCVFTNVGAAMAYIMFIQECTGFGTQGLVLLCVVTALPLCFMKDWESLSILSKIKAFVYAMIVLVVLVKPPFDDRIQKKAKDLSTFLYQTRTTWFSWNVFESLGTFAFASIYHDCMFPVKKTMRDQSIGAWSKASKVTLSIAFIINIVLGIGGFVNFRPKEKKFPENIFEAGKDRLFTDDIVFRRCRDILVALLLVTVPLCVHCARDYVEAMCSKISEIMCEKSTVQNEIDGAGQTTENNVAIRIPNTSDAEAQDARESGESNNIVEFATKFKMSATEYVISIGLFATSLFLAIVFCESTGIVGVIDAIGDYASASIGFIFPPIIYLCTFGKE
eukprot:430146_1